MHRQFQLSEIPLKEFNSHYLRYGLGAPRTLDSECRDGISKIRRFFRILNSVAYNGVGDILDQLRDDHQKPDAVWYSGQMPLSEAAEQTKRNYDDHKKLLLDKEADYNRLSVRLMRKRNKRNKGSYKQDIFMFDKERGLWVVRNFHIRELNFGFYNFEGVEGDIDPKRVHAVCGIYTGLQNARLQEALEKHSPRDLKVVRVTLKSGEECYVVEKDKYERKHDEQGLPLVFDPERQGENLQVKKWIENLVSYVRAEGIPVSVDEETWDALNFPVPAILIARHVE